MFKKEINNIILIFTSAHTKNAFHFFELLFLGDLSFKIVFGSTVHIFVLKFFWYLRRTIDLF